MHVKSSITFFRDVGRYQEELVEVTLPVSGRVLVRPIEPVAVLDRTIDPLTQSEFQLSITELTRGPADDGEYVVILDVGLGLRGQAEIERAEQALITEYEKTGLPYVSAEAFA